MSDKVYRIKPLGWARAWFGNCKAPTSYLAVTAFGNLSIQKKGLPRQKVRWCFEVFRDGKSIEIERRFKTAKLAIAAAEQWHRERMAAGLVEVQT